MNENTTATQWEERSDEENDQVANMDRYDFLTLLMESRIIQPS